MTPNETLNTAVDHLRAGRVREAIERLTEAIRVRPDVAEFHDHLGLALMSTEKLDPAIAHYEQAVKLKPDYVEAMRHLADALCIKSQWPAAIAMYERAAAIKPHDASSLRNLATALMKLGRFEQSLQCGRAALTMEPRHATPHVTLGFCLRAMGDVEGAMEEYRRALAVDGTCLEALNNLANILREYGRIPEAIDVYARAVQAAPNRADVASNRIYAMHYDAQYDSQALLREHLEWARRYAKPLESEIRPHANDRSPDRPLRIGYVSADLRAHVVGWNLLPMLSRHDHRQFEIFAYSGTARPDTLTGALRACCDSWRDIQAMSDGQVTQLIRADKIDILVDLTLHMANNRMLVFARKPAPVQLTYLGYCSTTGLATMDYRLSDPHLDPPDADLSCYGETTVRLPKSYWCYRPAASPPVAPSPAMGNGYPTFGCLNSFSKVSPRTLELWANILRDTPRSRLILHCLPGPRRNEVLQHFAARSVSADRIELVGFQLWKEYIQTYHRMDIALDPFPYGGGITTLDALWMGVPVVTLSGRTAVGRGGRSILCNLGLPELVAASEQDYAELAHDFGRWIQLRPGLRQRMMQSPLMDAAMLARDVEAAYRAMWKQWATGS